MKEEVSQMFITYTLDALTSFSIHIYGSMLEEIIKTMLPLIGPLARPR